VSTAEWVTCATCRTRTLARIAARDWPEGICELCRDPKLRRDVRRELARAKEYFAGGDPQARDRAERSAA
jgi:hypothetical protein